MRYTTLFLGLILSFFLFTPTSSFAQSEWQTVTAFEGQGTKNTHPILIMPDEWRLKWETESDYSSGQIFQVSLQKPSQNSPTENLVNVSNQGNASDVTNVYQSGEYYFRVNSANVDWKLIVQFPSD